MFWLLVIVVILIGPALCGVMVLGVGRFMRIGAGPDGRPIHHTPSKLWMWFILTGVVAIWGRPCIAVVLGALPATWWTLVWVAFIIFSITRLEQSVIRRERARPGEAA